jgi:hypothetical protein
VAALDQVQVTQRDGTFYLAFKYDASEMMSLSVYWGLDADALASSVEQWNLKHAAEAAAKAPSSIMSCLPMFARSYNQMRDEHVVDMSPVRASARGGAAAAAAGGAFDACWPSPFCFSIIQLNNPLSHAGATPSSFLNAASAVMCSTGFRLDPGLALAASIALGGCPQCPHAPALSSFAQPGKIALTLLFETSASHAATVGTSRYIATVIPVDVAVREDAADLLASSSVRTVYCVTSSMALTQQDM